MPAISTQNLKLLPNANFLRDLFGSVAMLDAILCPEWEDRCYTFDAAWGPREQMGSIRNSSGDDLYAVFNVTGCFMKGFAHESPVANRIILADHYRGVPAEFSAYVIEPAFSPERVTFCIWQSSTELGWQHNTFAAPPGDDPDGSAELLATLDGNPETYAQWAEAYYEQEISRQGVKAIYQRQKLTEDLVASLSPDLDLKDLLEDIIQIGYPV